MSRYYLKTQDLIYKDEDGVIYFKNPKNDDSEFYPSQYTRSEFYRDIRDYPEDWVELD